MHISRKNLFRFLIVFFCSITLLLINLVQFELLTLVLLFLFSYIITMHFFKTCLGTLKNLCTSIEAIFVSVYFVYAIMNSIQYIIDKGAQRTWYFKITNDTMEKTLTLYLSVFLIFVILLLVLNHPKRYLYLGVETRMSVNYKKTNNFGIFDLGAIGCLCIFILILLNNIDNIFSLSFVALRRAMTFEGQQYVWLYMMAYSISFLAALTLEKKYILKPNNMFRITIILLFWINSLLIDRRHFLPVLISIMIVGISTKKKIKIKTLIKIGAGFFSLMSLAVIRLGYSLGSLPIPTFMYTIFGEFILTNYVTNYYVANPITQIYMGKTYIWYTLTKLIPRALYPGKPVELGQIFYDTVIKSGSGFATNAVVEGFLNFGWVSIITTPLVMYFIMILGVKGSKKVPLFYVFMCAYSFDFFRGEFANCMFDILFVYVLLYFMSTVKKKITFERKG